MNDLNEFKTSVIEVYFRENEITRWRWWQKIYTWLGNLGQSGRSFGFYLQGFDRFDIDHNTKMSVPTLKELFNFPIEKSKRRFSLVILWSKD